MSTPDSSKFPGTDNNLIFTIFPGNERVNGTDNIKQLPITKEMLYTCFFSCHSMPPHFRQKHGTCRHIHYHTVGHEQKNEIYIYFLHQFSRIEASDLLLTGTDNIKQLAMTRDTMKRLKYRCWVMSYIRARKALLSGNTEEHCISSQH